MTDATILNAIMALSTSMNDRLNSIECHMKTMTGDISKLNAAVVRIDNFITKKTENKTNFKKEDTLMITFENFVQSLTMEPISGMCQLLRKHYANKNVKIPIRRSIKTKSKFDYYFDEQWNTDSSMNSEINRVLIHNLKRTFSMHSINILNDDTVSIEDRCRIMNTYSEEELKKIINSVKTQLLDEQ
jgi:hypothetical protein